MYSTSEGIWMHYGDYCSVARPPESSSLFNHLDFSDNKLSLHTAGLFYRKIRQSAKARVLKSSRRTILERELYLGPRSQYSHPVLMQSGITPREFWHYAERCIVITLTTLALLWFFTYMWKIFSALRLVSHWIPFRTVYSFLHSIVILTQIFQNQITCIIQMHKRLQILTNL